MLNFQDENDFYFIQIIKRRKENPEMGSNNITINYYYVYDLDKFNKIEEEIIKLCNSTNSRAYIHINKRNAHKIGLQTLRKISELIINNDFKGIKNAYNSCCGSYSSDENKKWVVDIDYKDLDVQDISSQDEAKENIERQIQMIEKIIKNNTSKPNATMTRIPTKNGLHVICSPFNLHQFTVDYGKKIDIHKENPTLCYCP